MEAHSVSFCVGQRTLLADLSLTVQPGEVVALIGPNGAGKSTFLKLLSGDLHPSSGEIHFDGRPLPAIPRWQIAQRRAILPQTSPVPFDFIALEVVEMGRLPHRSTPTDARIVQLALERTGTAHLRQRMVSTLSGGEMQRIHLARVLAQIWDPPTFGHRWLLLDEPTSSLDLAHQHSVLRLAREFSREGVGVLVVLHDLNLATQYADRLLLLQAGRCLALDTPENVFRQGLFSRVFEMDILSHPHPTTGCPILFPA